MQKDFYIPGVLSVGQGKLAACLLSPQFEHQDYLVPMQVAREKALRCPVAQKALLYFQE